MERSIITIHSMLLGRPVNLLIEASIDYERASYCEECWGSYRRVDEELVINELCDISLLEVEWEPRLSEGDYATSDFSFPGEADFDRWQRIVNRLPQEWFQLDQIPYDNEKLWEELF